MWKIIRVTLWVELMLWNALVVIITVLETIKVLVIPSSVPLVCIWWLVWTNSVAAVLSVATFPFLIRIISFRGKGI